MRQPVRDGSAGRRRWGARRTGQPAHRITRWLPQRSIRLRLTLLYGVLFLVSAVGLLVFTNVLIRNTRSAGVTVRSGPNGVVEVRGPVGGGPFGLGGLTSSVQLEIRLEPGNATFKAAAAAALPAGLPRPPNALAATKLESDRPSSGSASPGVSASGPTGNGSGAVGSNHGRSGSSGAIGGAGDGATSRVNPAAAIRRVVSALAIVQRSKDVADLFWYSVLALAVMVALSVALGWYVSGRVLRPLRTITATARRISASNLHERLALAGPHDELKELGDTIDSLLGRLELAFEAQRRFVAHASHELRTPLARQRAVGQVAISDPTATVESLRLAHERVLAAGAQQEAIIDALLSLARGEAGGVREDRIDLAALAGEALRSAAGEIERRGLRLESEIAPTVLTGNERLVERLVANLVDNAVRHNHPGGEITVSTSSSDGVALLCIANSGPIVASSELDRLLQPFQRLDPQRSTAADGLGLGLSIAKAVADTHGATLTITAREQGGLSVEVRFPPGGTTPPVVTPSRRASSRRRQ
jgi:signal transduction histidine kinase